MPTILLQPSGKTVTVSMGARLKDALQTAGLLLDYPCGGDGRCGQCRVTVSPAPASGTGTGRLSAREIGSGVRLACLLTLEGDCTVTIPEARLSRRRWDLGTQDLDLSLPRGLPPRPEGGLGLAIDLGTTTVDIALLDLSGGGVIGRRSFLNGQVAYGADVITRAESFHLKGQGVRTAILETIADGVVSVVNDAGLGPRKRGRTRRDIVKTVIVGNPIMLHILNAADPHPLTVAPFAPVFTASTRSAPGAFGWGFQASGEVETLPLVSAYVGADTVAMIVSENLDGDRGTVLAVDIGTNGEMVLSRGGDLTATSTAAGPAFEGAEISCGMRALEGAVYGVSILEDGSLSALVVGGGKPRGICGTGLVSAAAEMLDRGVVDSTGRMADGGEVPVHALARRIVTKGGEKAFVLDDDGEVFITQRDVRKLQLAKAALRAGVDALLQAMEAGPDGLDLVILAGKFGAGLDAAAAMRIGLIPRLDQSRVLAVGNSALRGACLCLLSATHSQRAEAAARKTSVVELGSRADFQTRFAEAMLFGDERG